MEAVLLLNADYTPLNVISLERAFSLILDEKVRLVSNYANRVLRSATREWDFPAVIALKEYVRPKKQIRFSRKNILARDAYTCQYCKLRPLKKSGNPDVEMLTIDHVVPRARARDGRVRVTSWENVVTACEPCNTRKADHDLGSVGMKFISPPRAPTNMDVIAMTVFRYQIPDEWGPWAGYWSTELADD